MEIVAKRQKKRVDLCLTQVRTFNPDAFNLFDYPLVPQTLSSFLWSSTIVV